jgi:hypothetical protein
MSEHANIKHIEFGEFSGVLLEKHETYCIVRVEETSPELEARGVHRGWPIALTAGKYELVTKEG